MILAQVLLYVTRLIVSRQKMLILLNISVSARRNKPQIRFSVAEDVCFCVFRVFKLGKQLRAYAFCNDRRTASVNNDCNAVAVVRMNSFIKTSSQIICPYFDYTTENSRNQYQHGIFNRVLRIHSPF